MKNKAMKRILSFFVVSAVVFSFWLVGFAAEQNSNSTSELSNGSGKVAKAELIVTKGAEGKMHVDMEVKSSTSNDLVQVIQKHQSHFTSEQYSQIAKQYLGKNKGFSASLLPGILDYLKNSKNKTQAVSNDEDQIILKESHDSTQREVKLTGDIEAKGSTDVPTRAEVFIQD